MDGGRASVVADGRAPRCPYPWRRRTKRVVICIDVQAKVKNKHKQQRSQVGTVKDEKLWVMEEW